MILSVDLELDDAVAAHLTAHLAGMRKPHRYDPKTGSITIDPLFVPGMELSQWIAELVSANIANTLRDNPTSAMLEQRRVIEAAEETIRASIAPTVSVRKGKPE